MLCVLAGAGQAQAESLTEVLGNAYLNNPGLRSERARLRATDEGVSQALAGHRPTITASGEGGYVDERRRAFRSRTGGERTPHGYNLTLNQPVFRGFKTVNETKQAEANVLAGRQSLIDVEQTTLLAAATAFMNVVRDQSIVNLRKKNVDVLGEQLRASQARFEVGEITRTDVAQARARRSGAISSLAAARADLSDSRAEFERLIGRRPGSLRQPRRLRGMLPRSLDRALKIARKRNPVLLNALHTEEAGRHAIEVAEGDLMPSVNLEAQYNRNYEPARSVFDSEDTRITGRISIPLYQGGGVHSQVRQAKQTASQLRLQTMDTERQVKAQVVNSWEALRAAREQIQAAQEQVRANELAYKGVKQEALVGSRTTLDVLDAEQELLDSRVSLVTARRDEMVASFQLMTAVGKFTARDLKLPVPYYDPSVHYDRVRGKLFGLGAAKRKRD